MSRLFPAADWTRSEDLARVVAALGAEQVRYVGGAVRDTLLGQPVHDIDLATRLRPEAVLAQLKAAGIRAVPTGLAHGTITAILPQGKVEVTTLRKDVSTDGRRATIAFAQDWRDDAARRDFTINALYVDPASLRIADHVGGLDDLAQARVRFIGDARQRIAEDHLRILRYYRFQARFGALLDGEAEEACAALAPTLKGLSRERVAQELLALLALPQPLATLTRMAARGVLGHVLPELAAAASAASGLATLAALMQTEAREGAAPAALRRLAALLPADAKAAEEVAARLRLANAQRKTLARLAARTGDEGADPLALAYRAGPEIARDLLLLQGRTPALLAGFVRPLFPLKGGEIVARGLRAGPQVAALLQRLEARWLAEGFPERQRVLAMLEEELSGLLPHA